MESTLNPDTNNMSNQVYRGGHDARAVANYFIAKLLHSPHPKMLKGRVTPLALQKLVYISHALTMLDLKVALVNESPRVGVYDPYFPSIRESLSYFGGLNVSVPIRDGTAQDVYEQKEEAAIIEHQFSEDEIEILDSVWCLYEKVDFDCTQLTYLTGGTEEEFKSMSERFGLDH